MPGWEDDAAEPAALQRWLQAELARLMGRSGLDAPLRDLLAMALADLGDALEVAPAAAPPRPARRAHGDHRTLQAVIAALSDDDAPDLADLRRKLARRLQALADQTSVAPGVEDDTPPVLPFVSVPVNPIMLATLQGLYASGPKTRWTADAAGRPQYRYEARDGHITLFFEAEPEGMQAVAALWDAVRDVSVETADVFLILMARIAELADPRRDTARIRLEEIADYRAVRVRRGTVHRLHEDFSREVLRLADLRLTMVWQDYRGRGQLTFGRRRPDRLLDIVDVELMRDGETWTAFGFRCGQALAHFLTPGDLRWIGRYARALLELNPHREALAKKVGTYWALIGTIAGKKGELPRATVRSLLEFCGEEPDWEHPGRTVDGVVSVHHRLQEIGLLEEVSALEPPVRQRGFFERWLSTPVRVRLSSDLWKVAQAPGRARLPTRRAQRPLPPRSEQTPLPLPPAMPANPAELQANPEAIRLFRMTYNLQQVELARAVGITRVTLSRYECQVRPVPIQIAARILALWREKAGS